MGAPTVDQGQGMTIVFGTSSWTAELLSLGWSGASREAIPTSHLGTAAPATGKWGNMTFMASDLTDPGSLDIEYHLNPDTTPLLDSVAETVTITFPSPPGVTTSGAKWSCSCFATAVEGTVPERGKMTGRVTLKITGNVQKTAAV